MSLDFLAGRKKGLGTAAVVLAVAFLVSLSETAPLDYSLSEARKVFEAIRHIQAAGTLPEKGALREIVIKESEFNSYIAYRIEHEKSEIMKKLELKFFNGNILEGHIFLDLKGQKLSRFLNPKMDIYFEAFLEVDNGRGRMKMKKIFLNGQPVHPMVLDMIITIASRVEPMEISSLDDWYTLPYGIRNIHVHKGRAVFYY
ncbi:MAG: hypothetical protein JXB26_03415 [Candidatus Aminicenantes bacterium]|nr:hypothetical protein [Candidatus Aminicenantes bacterium]